MLLPIVLQERVVFEFGCTEALGKHCVGAGSNVPLLLVGQITSTDDRLGERQSRLDATLQRAAEQSAVSAHPIGKVARRRIELGLDELDARPQVLLDADGQQRRQCHEHARYHVGRGAELAQEVDLVLNVLVTGLEERRMTSDQLAELGA
jgi:hypothetical protein